MEQNYTQEGLNQLQQEMSRVSTRYTDLKNQRDSFQYELTREAKLAIDAKVRDQFAAPMSEAYTAQKQMEEKLEQYLEGLAKLREYPWALGTKFTLWNATGYTRKVYVIKAKGVLEVFTQESIQAENSKYKRASPGDLVIRHLDKNGKPGKRLTLVSKTYGSYNNDRVYNLPFGWFLEGVDPQQQENERQEKERRLYSSQIEFLAIAAPMIQENGVRFLSKNGKFYLLLEKGKTSDHYYLTDTRFIDSKGTYFTQEDAEFLMAKFDELLRGWMIEKL